MGINRSVFASTSERTHFRALHRQFGQRCRLYPNLPFLNVLNAGSLVDPTTSVPFTLSDIEKARLTKTSIDYVLCDAHDKPLVAVDFDGWCEGVNIGSTYVPRRSAKQWRREIMTLKLRVAHGSQLPYFVVGSDEFEKLDIDVETCVVDALLGHVLASQQFRRRMTKPSAEDEAYAAYVRTQPEEKRFDLFEGHMLMLDIEAEIENNPVARLANEFMNDCPAGVSWGHSFTQYPPFYQLVGSDGLIHPELALMEGIDFRLVTPDQGEIPVSVMLPRFDQPGFSTLSILEDIAKVIAFSRYTRMRRGGVFRYRRRQARS